MVSLAVKNLCTIVPVDETITQAAHLIYQRTLIFDKNTFIRLMGLAVKIVSFQSGGIWYKQVNGLAMGSKVAVYLSNISLRHFEPYIGGALREVEIEPFSPSHMDQNIPVVNVAKRLQKGII